MLELTRLAGKAQESGAHASVTLGFAARRRTRQRLRLDDGREASLFLPRGTVLVSGDVLADEHGECVVVLAAAEAVSLAVARDARELARAAYHVGNRHAEAEFTGLSLAYLSDPVLDEMLAGLGLQVTHELRAFTPEGGAYAVHHPDSMPGQGEITLKKPQLRAITCTALSPRALQLASQLLPVGSFAYSQGLEWACEAGWVRDEATASAWIDGYVRFGVRTLDVPLLALAFQAWQGGRFEEACRVGRRTVSLRESAELRAQELAMGAALFKLLADLGYEQAKSVGPQRGELGFVCAFALAGHLFGLGLGETATAYAYSSVEALVAAAVKLVPLGQTAAQRILATLCDVLAAQVQAGLALPADEIGGTLVGAALASSLHEGLSTRLFRS